MKTLLALISPGKSKGTREGAIRGLLRVRKEAVCKGLVEGVGTKVVNAECQGGNESAALVNSVMDALRVLQPPFDMSAPGLYTETKPSVRVVCRALPTIDIGQEDTEIGQEHAWLQHLRRGSREAVEIGTEEG